jgi:endonuclease/exonuclease/phosphatase family metal-dependent hydrolase
MANAEAVHHHTIRVMTWNVRGVGRPDLAALARVVADVDPDVLALQEVRRSQAAALVDLLGFAEWRWLLKHRQVWPLGDRWAEGIAVLSRFPVREDRASVLTPHTSLRTFRRRVLQEVVVATAAGPVRIANTHLASDSDEARAEQAVRLVEALAQPLEETDVARTVLLGDLNTDDDDAVLGVLARGGLTDGPSGPTNPAGSVSQRLDHVLAGTDLELGDLVVPEDGPKWATLSDHLPVSADLHLGG